MKKTIMLLVSMAALMGATMAYAAEKNTAAKNTTVKDSAEVVEQKIKELSGSRKALEAQMAKLRPREDALRRANYKSRNIVLPNLTEKAEETEKQVKDIAIKVRAAEGKAKAAEERAKIAEARLAEATALEPAKKVDEKIAKD